DENGDRRKKTGATDKAVTERIARELENRVLLRREGVVDPKAEAYRDFEARPLCEHLDAWGGSLTAGGASPKHSDLFATRARRVVAVLMDAELAEIEPARNAKWADFARAEERLRRSIAPARLSDLIAERAQQALATLKAKGRSLATCNYHRAAI